MQVVRNFDRPAGPRCYSVAGRLLFIESPDPQLTLLIDELFGGWLLSAVSPDLHPPHISVTCHANQMFPQVPQGLDRFEIANGGHCYASSDSLYCDLSSSVVQIFAGDIVAVNLWLKHWPVVANANLARAVSFAVCAGLRRRGMFELHSAGLAAPEGSGVLIVGPSGSGKSTLTMQLLNNGWSYLSDDEVLLSVDNDEITARGFRRFFAVSDGSPLSNEFSVLDRNMARQPTATGPKKCFEPFVLFPGKHLESAVPRALFFTTLTGRLETRLTQLSQTETMGRLLRASPWATYDKAIAAENLKLLSKLARQSKGFNLEAGIDLLNPGAAAQLFGSYLQHA